MTMNTFTSSVLALIVGAMLVLTSACAPGPAYEMDATDRTPAAVGELDVDEDDSQNLRLDLAVSHLPPPERLDANLSTYVVWLRPSGEERYINLGALQINEDREAQLQATTPFRNFDLFVTAEESARTEQPSEVVVLQRRIDY
jgi:hypothetical protein